MYAGAYDNLYSILEKGSDVNKKQEKIYKEVLGEVDINNVIAFVGDRGSGKSSCMCSFANLLRNKNVDELKAGITDKTEFFVLPVIDPTKMYKGETIVGSICARLFQSYTTLEKTVSKEIPIGKKREMVKLFAKVIDNIQDYYNTGTCLEDCKCTIQKSSDIENINVTMCEMIEIFLKLKYDHDDSYLVIPIDDIDMNMEYAYSLLEEIRKFLMIPKVIILLSASMEQLNSVVAESFTQKSQYNYLDKSHSFRLAKQYLEKIIPATRRNKMPIINSYWLKSKKEIIISPDDESNMQSIISDIEEVLLKLIYQKSFLLFLPGDKERSNSIFPKRLRTLVHFAQFLYDLPSVKLPEEYNMPHIFSENDVDSLGIIIDQLKINKDVKSTLLSNIKKIEEYIYSNLIRYDFEECDTELLKALKKVIDDLYYTPDMSNVNNIIVTSVIRAIEKDDSLENTEIYFEESYDGIYEAALKRYGVSMGDVMYILGKLEKHINTRYTRHLISMIRVFWTTAATYEFFREMTLESLDINNDRNTTNFRDMVGGFFFNPDVTNFLKPGYSSSFNLHKLKCIKNSEGNNGYALNKECDGMDISINYNNPYVHIQRSFITTKFICPKRLWRTEVNLDNKPYYRTSTENPEDLYFYFDFMSSFTNMIYTPNDQEAFEKFPEKFQSWSKKHALTLPFFSMDYMNQLFIQLNYLNKSKARSFDNHNLRPIDKISLILNDLKNVVSEFDKNFLNYTVNRHESNLKKMTNFESALTEWPIYANINKLKFEKFDLLYKEKAVGSGSTDDIDLKEFEKALLYME